MPPFGVVLDLDHTLLHTCTEGGDEEGSVSNAQQLATRALAKLITSMHRSTGGNCNGGALDIVLHPSHPRIRTFNANGKPTHNNQNHTTNTATAGLAYIVIRPHLFQFLCYLVDATNIAEIAVWSAGGSEYVMSLVEKILLPLMSCAFHAMHPKHRTDVKNQHNRVACTRDGPHRYMVSGTNHRKGSIVVYTGGNCEANNNQKRPPKCLDFITHRPGVRWILLDDIPENVGLELNKHTKALDVQAVENGGFMWIPPFNASTGDGLRDKCLLSAIKALDTIKKPPNGLTDKKKRRGSITTVQKSCRTYK